MTDVHPTDQPWDDLSGVEDYDAAAAAEAHPDPRNELQVNAKSDLNLTLAATPNDRTSEESLRLNDGLNPPIHHDPYVPPYPRRTNLTMLDAFYRRAKGEIEDSREMLEAHCIHGYEGDQHYVHDGPHELASWREVVQLRAALTEARIVVDRVSSSPYLAELRDRAERAEAELAAAQQRINAVTARCGPRIMLVSVGDIRAALGASLAVAGDES